MNSSKLNEEFCKWIISQKVVRYINLKKTSAYFVRRKMPFRRKYRKHEL